MTILVIILIDDKFIFQKYRFKKRNFILMLMKDSQFSMEYAAIVIAVHCISVTNLREKYLDIRNI